MLCGGEDCGEVDAVGDNLEKCALMMGCVKESLEGVARVLNNEDNFAMKVEERPLLLGVM